MFAHGEPCGEQISEAQRFQMILFTTKTDKHALRASLRTKKSIVCRPESYIFMYRKKMTRKRIIYLHFMAFTSTSSDTSTLITLEYA